MEMANPKTCEECLANIDVAADRCPHCGSRRENNVLGYCILVVTYVLYIVIIYKISTIAA